MKLHDLKIVVTTILTLVISVTMFSSCDRENGKTVVELRNDSVREGTININTASEKDLQALPGIGETLAKRIVQFREANGSFRRPEHLLLVPGISEKRFREIKPLIRSDQLP